jgi:hypothetical protein
MYESMDPKKLDDYPYILMEDDLKLDTFIFPKVLYVLKGFIVGYSERYFPGNIFTLGNPTRVNIDNLIKARDAMIEDAKEITKRGYNLFELPCNLCFDNKRLAAIDTLDYEKQEDITLERNISTINYAILSQMALINPKLDVYGSFEEELRKVVDTMGNLGFPNQAPQTKKPKIPNSYYLYDGIII